MKPYYAVIFTSLRKNEDEGYNLIAAKMEELAQRQQGYIHHNSARSEVGITVSYWQSLEDITAWKNQLDHQLAQQLGKAKWYEWYRVRICKVEREYEFNH